MSVLIDIVWSARLQEKYTDRVIAWSWNGDEKPQTMFSVDVSTYWDMFTIIVTIMVD